LFSKRVVRKHAPLRFARRCLLLVLFGAQSLFLVPCLCPGPCLSMETTTRSPWAWASPSRPCSFLRCGNTASMNRGIVIETLFSPQIRQHGLHEHEHRHRDPVLFPQIRQQEDHLSSCDDMLRRHAPVSGSCGSRSASAVRRDRVPFFLWINQKRHASPLDNRFSEKYHRQHILSRNGGAILSSCFLCRRPPSAVRRGERRCFPLFPGGAAGMVEARMILLHRSSARSESDHVEEGV